MEFPHLSVFALLCQLVIMGTHASQSAEDYWHSVSPNTALPKALSDLLLPYSETNPIKAEEEKQYWTVFFEHDLHPGKKMNMGFHKHSDIQPFGAFKWSRKTSQPFGAWIWSEKTSQPFGAWIWSGKTSQPSGLKSLRRKAIESERHIVDFFCEGPRAVGENKYCASSLESMMDFAISKLGKDIKVFSSSFAPNKDQYMVEEVRKIGDNMVMCHRLNYENAVFYCHQINATTSYMVPLVASDGTKAKALTICHHDTRGMDPDLLYQVLKVKPGTVPVCHFIGNKAIAWVPNPVVSESDHPCVI